MKKNDFFSYLDKLEEKDELLKRWGELYLQEEKLIQTIIESRKAKGISQKELAQLTGIKQPAIARIESGAHSPQINTLINIIEALDLKLTISPKCEVFLESIWHNHKVMLSDSIFYSKITSTLDFTQKSGDYIIKEGGHLNENQSYEYPCKEHYPA